MISLILILGVAVLIVFFFYRLAAKYEKKALLTCIIALGSTLLVLFLLGYNYIFAILILLVIAYAYLQHRWEKEKPNPFDDIDQIGKDN